MRVGVRRRRGLFMLDEIGMDMCRRVGDLGYSCLMR